MAEKPDAVDLQKMDHYAALLGRQLVAMGLTIGKDVMLAGFDDEPFAGLLPVPLTTIHFHHDPFAQICYKHWCFTNGQSRCTRPRHDIDRCRVGRPRSTAAAEPAECPPPPIPISPPSGLL